MHDRLWRQGMLVLGIALATVLMVACGEGTRINGCYVEGQTGGTWGDLNSLADWRAQLSFNGFARWATMGCPIKIYQTGENVWGAADVYDHTAQLSDVKVNRVANLRFASSTNTTLRENQTYSENFGYEGSAYPVRVFHLSGQYAAATGRRTFDDVDFMIIRIVRGICCQDAYAEVRLNYQQDTRAHVSISGEELPLQGTTQEWLADTDNGGHPHSYNWYRNGTWVASGYTYSESVGGDDFDLRVDMQDTYGRTASHTLRVDVDGVRPSISGPSTIWASQGGGTWTASGRGGYQPYLFRWYIDGQLMGEGPSFSGYKAGSESWDLRVDITDAHGNTFSQSMAVRQFGPGDGTACDPPFGQSTC